MSRVALRTRTRAASEKLSSLHPVTLTGTTPSRPATQDGGDGGSTDRGDAVDRPEGDAAEDERADDGDARSEGADALPASGDPGAEDGHEDD